MPKPAFLVHLKQFKRPLTLQHMGVIWLILVTCAPAQITKPEDLGLLMGRANGVGLLIQPSAPSVVATDSMKVTSGFHANLGPWGELHGDYIFLEAPKSLLENFPLPSTQPRWTFPLSFLPSIPVLLKEAGLADSLIAALTADDRLVKELGLVHIKLTVAELESLTPQSRSSIYSELRKHPQNEYHADPVLIIGTTVQEWYQHSKLRSELIKKIEQLSYMRGEAIAFSDIPALLSYAQSDSEARQIFKACTRTRSLMLRLSLNDKTNIEELLSYWSFGIGIRRKDIEPIIQSIIDSETLHDLPLTHILPALPRKLIYTYPGLDMAKDGLLPDCHWTSLNFYNFEPHQYLLDSRLATSQVLEQFDAINASYKYGDILFFLDNATGDAFHSCVYLADDIVYTKNGRNILSPWVLMKVEDVKKIYIHNGNGRVQGFRRKDIVAKAAGTL
jgi:hypothetical protein